MLLNNSELSRQGVNMGWGWRSKLEVINFLHWATRSMFTFASESDNRAGLEFNLWQQCKQQPNQQRVPHTWGTGQAAKLTALTELCYQHDPKKNTS